MGVVTLSPRSRSIATWALWPLAVMTWIHKVFIAPHSAPTDDFTTVISALRRFTEGTEVYNEDYSSVDPHYLYSPGGTLLLSPLTLFPTDSAARAFYIGLNAFAAIVAIALLLKIFKYSLSGPLLPALIFISFSTESIYNTLAFTNINCVLLLLEVSFIWALLQRKNILAGLLIAVAITIKPQFLPLLVIPALRRQWTTVGLGVFIPGAINLAAFPFMIYPMAYVHRVMPYLGIVRDHANSSIAGLGAYIGLPDWNILLWRAIGACIVGIVLLLLLRWKDRDEVMWISTTTGAILIGVFLLSSLGQMYYTMLALPMFFSVVRYRSVMHNPVVWLGMYFCLSLDSWYAAPSPGFGIAFENARGTIGWLLIMIGAAASLILWTYAEKRRNIPLLGDVSTYGLFTRPSQSAKAKTFTS